MYVCNRKTVSMKKDKEVNTPKTLRYMLDRQRFRAMEGFEPVGKEE